MNNETLKNIITDEGGYRAEPYLCSAGKITWLVGRNIEDRPVTQDEWDALKDNLKRDGSVKTWALGLFQAEILRLRGRLYCYGFDYSVPTEVTCVVLNMAYNMGATRFNPKKWPNFFGALKRGDWEAAAVEMEFTDHTRVKNSKWSQDVGSRAVRLIKAMRRTV